jgi:hypothetical protein
MGLRPSPIAQEVPDNYDLYVTGQDNATTTDLVTCRSFQRRLLPETTAREFFRGPTGGSANA